MTLREQVTAVSIIRLNHYLVHCEKRIRTVYDACAKYSKNLIQIIIF